MICPNCHAPARLVRTANKPRSIYWYFRCSAEACATEFSATGYISKKVVSKLAPSIDKIRHNQT